MTKGFEQADETIIMDFLGTLSVSRLRCMILGILLLSRSSRAESKRCAITTFSSPTEPLLHVRTLLEL